MQKIYLAGPDVFHPRAREHAAALVELCSEYGFVGMFPADGPKVDPSLTGLEWEAAVFQRDADMVRDCDIVAANLNPFRGAEPDSGTAFELGLGYALGKLLYGYTGEFQTELERVEKYKGGTDPAGFDSDGMRITGAGPINLMLSVPATMVYGSFEDCLRRIRSDLDG